MDLTGIDITQLASAGLPGVVFFALYIGAQLFMGRKGAAQTAETQSKTAVSLSHIGSLLERLTVVLERLEPTIRQVDQLHSTHVTVTDDVARRRPYANEAGPHELSTPGQ